MFPVLLEQGQFDQAWIDETQKMHAHASVFTLHRHARSRIGLAFDRREVASLQRILQSIAPHALDGNDNSGR
ncbi:hypothetical protein [Burkholderia sp. Ac-20344]|uniref:hypothetical protein n=1 Tax=Burkholderia sp. Ac-20344 TaxID=2703890 RepID=UPI001F11BE16|nr:hypothetical protein [Burkholderia sp. Ac-20344]